MDKHELYDFLAVGDVRWKVTNGLDGTLHPWKMDWSDKRLCRARIHDEKLPESAWPTNPGDKWHGMVGTTRTVVDGWDFIPLTGELQATREADGLESVFVFVNGYLAAIRAPGGEDELPEERGHRDPVSGPEPGYPYGSSVREAAAGSALLARIAAGEYA